MERSLPYGRTARTSPRHDAAPTTVLRSPTAARSCTHDRPAGPCRGEVGLRRRCARAGPSRGRGPPPSAPRSARPTLRPLRHSLRTSAAHRRPVRYDLPPNGARAAALHGAAPGHIGPALSRHRDDRSRRCQDPRPTGCTRRLLRRQAGQKRVTRAPRGIRPERRASSRYLSASTSANRCTIDGACRCR